MFSNYQLSSHEKVELPLILTFLLFSTQTSARFCMGIIGPSEIAMLLFALVSIKHMRTWRVPRLAALAWLGFATVLAIGWGINRYDNPASTHNAIAYGFAAFSSLVLLAYYRTKPFAYLRLTLCWMLLLAGIALVADFIPFFVGVQLGWPFSQVDPIYGDRYAAWAVNPNQLALWFVPIPAIIIALAKGTAFSRRALLKFSFAMYLCCLIGISIRSDALLLSWALMLPGLMLLQCVLKTHLKGWTIAVACVAFVAAYGSFKLHAPLDSPAGKNVRTILQAGEMDVHPMQEMTTKTETSSASTITTTPSKQTTTTATSTHTTTTIIRTKKSGTHADKADEASTAQQLVSSPWGVGYGQNKLSVREELWHNSFAVFQSSPIFGHGPGAFSWLEQGTDAMESHNTLIDILTQGGVLGTAIFLALYAYLVCTALRTRCAIALTILGGLFIFSMVHFVGRMPIFWFYLILCHLIIQHHATTRDNPAPCAE